MTYFYLFIVSLIPLGVLFNYYDVPGGAMSFSMGMMLTAIFLLVKMLREVYAKTISKLAILLHVMNILMCIILFAKYQYWLFGDYPGLLIIPIYIILSLFALIKHPKLDLKLTITSVLFLLLCIPLFGFRIYQHPREYIPQEWYKNSFADTETIYNTRLIPTFKNRSTGEFYHTSIKLRREGEYLEAIKVLDQVLKMEPDNAMVYFNLSLNYGDMDSLDLAVAAIDTAIMLDDVMVAYFYNQRGLLYYNLGQYDEAIEDYSKAIDLEPNESAFYMNIALSLFHKKEYSSACEAIKSAEANGANLDNQLSLSRVKDIYCK